MTPAPDPPPTGRELAEALRANGLIGMWADRDDIGDSPEFARKLREGHRMPETPDPPPLSDADLDRIAREAEGSRVWRANLLALVAEVRRLKAERANMASALRSIRDCSAENDVRGFLWRVIVKMETGQKAEAGSEPRGTISEN